MDLGDEVVYSYTVTNTGSVRVGSISVSGSRVSGVACSRTSLSPGASASCVSGRATIGSGDAVRHAIVSTASASGRANGHTVHSRSVTVSRFVYYVAHPGRPGNGSHPSASHHPTTSHHPARHQHPKRSFGRMSLQQWVVREVDSNNNRRIDAGEKIVYGFKVTNTGTRSLSGVHVVDAKLSRNKTSVFCSSSAVAPGTSVYCQSAELAVTPFMAVHTIGQNFAYALAVDTTGTSVHSNSSLTTVGSQVGDVHSSTLAYTGTEVDQSLSWSFGLIGLGGLLLLSTRVRRRVAALRMAYRPAHATSGP